MSVALRKVERIREQSVDDARAAHRSVLEELSRHEALVRELQRELDDLCARQERARTQSLVLPTPQGYTRAERHQQALAARASHLRTQLQRAEARRVRAREAVEHAERALIETELARRLVTRAVQQRDAEAARASELRTEEETCDNHRPPSRDLIGRKL